MKVHVKRLDGTSFDFEGTPEECAKVLRGLDREQMAPPAPAPYIPADGDTWPWARPCGPYIQPTISPTILPAIPGWPIIVCKN